MHTKMQMAIAPIISVRKNMTALSRKELGLAAISSVDVIPFLHPLAPLHAIPVSPQRRKERSTAAIQAAARLGAKQEHYTAENTPAIITVITSATTASRYVILTVDASMSAWMATSHVLHV